MDKPAKYKLFEILFGGLELDDVTFTFQGKENEPVVNGHFRCALAAGETVALVGPSGGGKSTISGPSRPGLLTPDCGAVALGGKASHPAGDWRRVEGCIGYLLQRTELFRGSIAEKSADGPARRKR